MRKIPADEVDMERSPESARAIIRGLAEVAERLASRDIVVGRLWCDWSAFGSWVLHATRGEDEQGRLDALLRQDFKAPGPEVIQIAWDGKEQVLFVDSSPSGIMTAMNKWQRQMEREFESPDDALPFAEDYLMKYFA